MILIVDRQDAAQIVQLSALLRASLEQGEQIMKELDDLRNSASNIVASIHSAADVMAAAATKLASVAQAASSGNVDPADLEAVSTFLQNGADLLSSATATLQNQVNSPAPATAPAPAPAPAGAPQEVVAPAPVVPAPGGVGTIG
jgi:ABC-type transporter Mla subunit MlaD